MREKGVESHQQKADAVDAGPGSELADQGVVHLRVTELVPGNGGDAGGGEFEGGPQDGGCLLYTSFATSRTEIACRLQNGSLALVAIGNVTRIVDQLGCAANGAFHGHNSLNETISTSSITVNLT